METHLLLMMLDTEEDKFSKNLCEFINIVRRLKYPGIEYPGVTHV